MHLNNVQCIHEKYCVTHIKYQSYFCMWNNDDGTIMLYTLEMHCQKKTFRVETIKEKQFHENFYHINVYMKPISYFQTMNCRYILFRIFLNHSLTKYTQVLYHRIRHICVNMTLLGVNIATIKLLISLMFTYNWIRY